MGTKQGRQQTKHVHVSEHFHHLQTVCPTIQECYTTVVNNMSEFIHAM